jgi:site-specific DNA-methyltransferase (adenine-specific)
VETKEVKTEREFKIEHNERAYTLHNVDCLEGMRERLNPGSVDVVVTSPPYNLGTSYKSYDDTIERSDYIGWMGEWGKAVSTVLSDEGSLFLNIGGKPSDPWGPFEVLFELRKYFTLQNTIHWIKSIAIQKEDVGRYPGISGNVSVGHYKPINSSRFINDCHEYVFHLTKTGNVALDRLSIGVEYQDKSNIARFGGANRLDRRCRGNTWFVPYKTIKNRDKQRPHPATFPTKIPQMCIQLHGIERTQLVLDPFMGIGHTAIACAQLHVSCVGFELEADYFAQSQRVLEEALATKD